MKKEHATKWLRLPYVRILTLIPEKMLGLLLTTVFLMQSPLQARDSLSEIYVSVSVKNQPVKEVLHTLEHQTGYKFFYLSKQIDANRKVTLSFTSTLLSEALNRLFNDTPVTFRINGKQIILKSVEQQTSVGTQDSAFTKASSDEVNMEALEALQPLALQPDIPVRGKVLSETGDPIPGVNVLIQGTTSGTTTSTSGEFTLQVPDNNTVLVFSFIGYKSQTVTVGTTSFFNITLAADVKILDDVVVVGYGTTSKRSLTGSVSTVKSKDLVSMKAPSVDAMLQGQGSGIQVNQATGTPGGPVRVMIRGTHSLSAGSEPLWVIDGIPVNNDLNSIGAAGRGSIPQSPLASINPNDIESIEVLKDASATAIYGSRGSNGVVLITTKSGRSNKGTITVDASYGVNELTRQPKDMGFANAKEWLSIVNQARTNAGILTSEGKPSPIEDNLVILNAVKAGPATLTKEQLADNFWFDKILRTGSFQEYNISSSKGNDKGSLFISGNYRKDQGVLKNNDFERLSFRINSEYEPARNLITGIRINLSHTKNQRALNLGAPSGNDGVAAGGFGEAAGGSLPILPVYDSQGNYFNPVSGSNLAATTDAALFRDQVLLYRALAGVYLEYKIPFIKGLSLRTEWSADLSYTDRLFWASDKLRPTGLNYAETATSFGQNLNYNGFVKYATHFGEHHKLNVVAGAESQRFSSRSANLFGEGIPGVNQDFGAPTAVITRAPSAGLGGERYLRAYFGRLDYSFKNKYLLGASFRRDGVSIFRPNSRWGNFSALSAGWIFSEETFMKGFDFLSFGKLRASFGQTGNQSIYEFATYTTAVDWPRYGSTAGAKNVNQIGNENLTWETSNSYDAALELGFFQDRLTVSAGYYRQDVKDMLFRVPVALSVGLFEGSFFWANVANMRNQGFEFSVNTVNIDRDRFKWSTSFNLTTNKNEIVSIIPELDKQGQGLISGLTRNIAGKPLSTFFVAEYAGVDPKTGVPMIYEIDRVRFAATGETVKTGNVIPATNANIPNHRILQDKTGLPTFFGGITNTINYRGLELTALFTFQGGNYLYNAAELSNIQVGQGQNNLDKTLLTQSWTPKNPQGKYPKLAWNNSYNINNEGNPNFNADGTPNNNVNYAADASDRAISRYVYKGDFLRLRTLQLAYSFAPELVKKVRLQAVRAYVSGNNLLTLTQYPGWDPEQLNYSSDSQARNLSQGVASNTLPPLKSYTVGLSITF